MTSLWLFKFSFGSDNRLLLQILYYYILLHPNNAPVNVNPNPGAMRRLAGHLQFINAPMSDAFASFRSLFRITGDFGGDLTMDLRYILHLALIILASARCFDHTFCLDVCV